MYGVTIDSLTSSFFPNVNKVLCKETSLVWQGLSNTWGIPLQFYYSDGDVVNSSYIIGYKDETDLIGKSLVVHNGLTCISIEDSICDLLEDNDSDPQVLFESLEDYYYNSDFDIEYLLEVASKRGIRDVLDEHLLDIKDLED